MRRMDRAAGNRKLGENAPSLSALDALFDLADTRDDSARKHVHDLAASLSRRLAGL